VHVAVRAVREGRVIFLVSTPMVSGAVAILLQDEPNLTPDQVKYRLMTTANLK